MRVNQYYFAELANIRKFACCTELEDILCYKLMMGGKVKMENINLFNIMLVSHHMVNQITMRTWEGNICFYLCKVFNHKLEKQTKKINFSR